MPLTPQDIVRKEFREALRGYNQSDVDLFLDAVVEDFVRISEDNQKMKVKLAALQQEVARYRAGRTTTPTGAVGRALRHDEAARLDPETRARLRRLAEEQLRVLDETQPPDQPRGVPPASPDPRYSFPSDAAAPALEPEPSEPFWANE